MYGITYVYIYIYMIVLHIYIHADIHTYVHTYIHTYIHIRQMDAIIGQAIEHGFEMVDLNQNNERLIRMKRLIETKIMLEDARMARKSEYMCAFL